MSEKRVVSRREPIVVEVEGVGEFSARPLPWRKRNDLGNMISEQYIAALNELLAQAKPDEGKATRISLIESGMDFMAFLEAAFPDGDHGDFELLDFEGVVAVLSASLEVNGLDRMVFMIDPSVKGPETEPEVAEGATDGARIASLPASSSPESDATNETS